MELIREEDRGEEAEIEFGPYFINFNRLIIEFFAQENQGT